MAWSLSIMNYRDRYFLFLYAAFVSGIYSQEVWVSWAEKLIKFSTYPKGWVIEMSYLRGEVNADPVKESLVREMNYSWGGMISLDKIIISFLHVKYFSSINDKDGFVNDVVGRGVFQDCTFREMVEIADTERVECLKFVELMNDDDFLRGNKWIYDQAE